MSFVLQRFFVFLTVQNLSLQYKTILGAPCSHYLEKQSSLLAHTFYTIESALLLISLSLSETGRLRWDTERLRDKETEVFPKTVFPKSAIRKTAVFKTERLKDWDTQSQWFSLSVSERLGDWETGRLGYSIPHFLSFSASQSTSLSVFERLRDWDTQSLSLISQCISLSVSPFLSFRDEKLQIWETGRQRWETKRLRDGESETEKLRDRETGRLRDWVTNRLRDWETERQRLRDWENVKQFTRSNYVPVSWHFDGMFPTFV